jgi:hypothetical protein
MRVMSDKIGIFRLDEILDMAFGKSLVERPQQK